MTELPRLTHTDAEQTYCSTCGAMPGHPCTFVLTGNLRHPGSTSRWVLADRARVGTPTSRPHAVRHRHPLRRLHLWLQEYGPILWEDL